MAKITVTTDGATVIVSDGDLIVIDIPGGGTVNLEAADGSVNNFNIRFSGDDHSDTANVDLSSFAADGLLIGIFRYDPTDVLNLNGAFNMSVDPATTDEMDFEYVGSDGNTHLGYVEAHDGGQRDFTAATSPIIICFTPGTLIATPKGEVPVEDLIKGDLVITADNGLQAVRWIGRKWISGARLVAFPELRPVRIRENAFGAGLPTRDMWVSPQHRILVKSERALMEHGETELLAPAKGLLNDHSVTTDYGMRETEYIHILFDTHEIIFANGLPTESNHPGLASLTGMEERSRAELFSIFPELQENPTQYGPSARLGLRPREAKLLFRKNHQFRKI